MDYGEPKREPNLTEITTISSVLKTIEDGLENPSKQFSYEELFAINAFITETYRTHGDPTVWSSICRMPVDDFLRKAGKFFLSKTEKTDKPEDEWTIKNKANDKESFYLKDYLWFQIFRMKMIQGKTS